MSVAVNDRTFADAWALVRASPEWHALSPETRHFHTRRIERFLATETKAETETGETWSVRSVADFKKQDMKELLSGYVGSRHAGRKMLAVVRRMIGAAIDAQWIDADPTRSISWSVAYQGWRSWTDDEMQRFEAYWPIGSTPRTVYALALWLGNRRGDVVGLRWDQRRCLAMMIDERPVLVDGFDIVQQKGGKRLMIPVTPMLDVVLAGAPRRGETIVVTTAGTPFARKSLTKRMASWRRAAGLPDGCTLHGLRKGLGRLMAESGATTREIMDVLGHTDIRHAELYSRQASQIRLAVSALEKVTTFHRHKTRVDAGGLDLLAAPTQA